MKNTVFINSFPIYLSKYLTTAVLHLDGRPSEYALLVQYITRSGAPALYLLLLLYRRRRLIGVANTLSPPPP
jgi:hypothetical protein